MMLSGVYIVDDVSNITTPEINHFIIYQLSTNGNFYALLHDRTSILIAGSTLQNPNNFFVENGNLTLEDEQQRTSLYAVQLNNDLAYKNIVLNFLESVSVIGIQSVILENIIFSALTEITESAIISGNDSLQTIQFINLETIGTFFNCESNGALITVNLTSLNSVVNISFNNCDSLTTLLITDTLNNCTDFTATNCALNQTSMDLILLACDNGGELNGNCLLNGGTNSAPTGGILNANYVSLGLKGWTVSINP